VQEDTPLDVSAAKVDVDLSSQSGNVSVDLASDSLAGSLDVDLASVSAGTLAVEQQTPIGVENSTGTQIDPATSTDVSDAQSAIKGGESLAGVVDALDQNALAQINELDEVQAGGDLQAIVDAVNAAALALAVDHPSRSFTGVDLSAGDLTIGPLQVQRARDIRVAGNPTGGGSFSVSLDHNDGSGATFATDAAISSSSAETTAEVARKGPYVTVTVSGTDTSTNLFIDTYQ